MREPSDAPDTTVAYPEGRRASRAYRPARGRRRVVCRAMAKRPPARVSDLLRAPTSGLDLAAVDARATPGFDGGKSDGRDALAPLGARLASLQEKLYADGRSGGTRSVLLVLQG